MGNNSVSVAFSKIKTTTTFTITQISDEWTILFEQPIGKYKVWKLNGKTIQPEIVGLVEQIKITSKQALVSLVN
jgi:hypothetical protein